MKFEHGAIAVALAAVVYWSGSMFVYSAMHPSMTQMEVFLNTYEALTWLW